MPKRQDRLPAGGPASPTVAEADSEPPERLVLDVVIEDDALWSPVAAPEAAVARVARAFAVRPGLLAGPAAACVALATDAAVQRLNHAYLGRDKPTNVLSFPAPSAPRLPVEGARRFLGDVVLAAETVLAEAADAGIPPDHHLQHLVLHGLLHLVGYDHEEEAAAAGMEAIEIEVLAGLGISNPYAPPR